jgi:hypothetical protein
MYREELCDGDYENDEDFEHVGYISEGEEYSNSEYIQRSGTKRRKVSTQWMRNKTPVSEVSIEITMKGKTGSRLFTWLCWHKLDPNERVWKHINWAEAIARLRIHFLFILLDASEYNFVAPLHLAA